jgi:hypothetical protein
MADDGVTGTGTPDDPYVFPPETITGPGDGGVTGTGTGDDPYVFPPETITGPGDRET